LLQVSASIRAFFPKLGKCLLVKPLNFRIFRAFYLGTRFVIRQTKEYLMKILLITVALAVCIPAMGQKQHSGIKIISTSDGVFHFKVAKKLRGAVVEVFDCSNRLISKQGMHSKRMIIDFYRASPGTYQIQISVDDFIKRFQYTIVEELRYMKIVNSEMKETDLSFER